MLEWTSSVGGQKQADEAAKEEEEKTTLDPVYLQKNAVYSTKGKKGKKAKGPQFSTTYEQATKEEGKMKDKKHEALQQKKERVKLQGKATQKYSFHGR